MLGMNEKNRAKISNSIVAWVLITLLAIIFVVLAFVDQSYKSVVLYVACLASLVALAFIAYRNRQDT